MARGYPDFFTFTYGLSPGPFTVQNALVGAVAPGPAVTIFLVEQRGLTKGGVLHVWNPTSVDDASIRITIDGVQIFNYTISQFLGWGFTHPGSSPLYVVHHDVPGLYFIFLFSPGILFGTSYRVEITNGALLNVTPGGAFWYSLVR